MLSRIVILALCFGLWRLSAGQPPAIRLIEEIETRSAAEPPVLGIDTQIRAAAAIAARQPDEASRLLRLAESRIAGLTHLPTRVHLLCSWLAVQMPLDSNAAELALTGLAGALPVRPLNGPESDALRRLNGRIAVTYPELAARLLARATAPPEPEKPASTGLNLFSHAAPSLDGLTPDDILLRARKERNPADALDLLMHIMDLEDDRRRRLTILSEALDLSARLEDWTGRLLAQSMLARRLLDAGDTPRAAVAAQMLSETFEFTFHCDTAACDHFDGEDGPGEIIYSFAEYLREHHIDPARLGLEHPSLRVRLLILDLAELPQASRDGQ
jgi:hypothetical protein